jgi:predicted nucleotidyltransferase
MGSKRKSLGLAGALFPQVQLRVLSLLIGHPERSYQLTDVIRLANSGRGAVQRELEKLANVGILNRLVSGRRKLYQANRNSPIFDELRGIILKTAGLADPLRNALKPFGSRIESAFVYGSVAKGRDTAASDIDLMIIGHELAYGEIYAAVQKAEKIIGRQVNPNLMTLNEWKSRLANDNPFVRGISRQPKLYVVGTDI